MVLIQVNFWLITEYLYCAGEDVLDTAEDRINQEPERMAARRNTVKHAFGTLKVLDGYIHVSVQR